MAAYSTKTEQTLRSRGGVTFTVTFTGAQSIQDLRHRQFERDRAEREAQAYKRWEAISEERAGGYMQAMDHIVRMAEKADLDKKSHYISGAGTFGDYYDKLILKRLQTVEDDWFALPTYNGWRFSSFHFDERPALCLIELEEEREVKSILVWVPPKPLTEAAFEIFQTLCRDAAPEVDIDEIARKAELLA